MAQIRKKLQPIDSSGYEELTIAVVGAVNSGKSTTVGSIITGQLDNGSGLTRKSVFVHPHEQVHGQTSDISYQYFVDEEAKRIYTFVDLAGHEMYLRTTVAGLSSAYPDVAIVCINTEINKMTKEHMGLLIAMQIPFIILFTKIDIINSVTLENLIRMTKTLLTRSAGRNLFCIKTVADFDSIYKDEQKQNSKIIPYVLLSNTTGQGHDLLKYMFSRYKNRQRHIPNGFVVEHIYNVPGHGIVLSGIAGFDICIGQTLFIGPFNKGDFLKSSVRSIHNDYRFDIKTLPKGKKGCIAINIRVKDKIHIRKGLILSDQIPENICSEFEARLKILHHATTIRIGYQAMLNCGVLRESVVFTDLRDVNNLSLPHARSDNDVIVRMKFQRCLNYVEVGQTFVFREGQIRGVGTIIKLLPL